MNLKIGFMALMVIRKFVSRDISAEKNKTTWQ